MELKMVCTYPFRGDDNKVLEYLEKCEEWPTNEEIVSATGLRIQVVERVVQRVKSQQQMYEARKKYFSETNDNE